MGANASGGKQIEISRKRSYPKILAWSLVGVSGLLVTLALLVMLSFKTFQHFYAEAPDPIVAYQVDKTLKARIPDWIPAEVKVDGPVPVKLSKVLKMEIPIKRDLDVLLDDDFIVPVDTSVTIPIDQEIYVEAEVPVETRIPLDGIRVQTSLWGLKRVTLPLSGSFPVNTSITLKKKIRVKTEAHVRIQKEVTTHVRKQLTLPLDLKVKVELPINDVFDVRFGESLTVKTRLPEEMPVNVNMRFALTKEQGLVTE